jgi:hypothetical protein
MLGWKLINRAITAEIAEQLSSLDRIRSRTRRVVVGFENVVTPPPVDSDSR